jgi:outer membrane biosynthesis protein TonB
LASAAPTAHPRTGALDLGALAAADPKPTKRATTAAQVKGPARPETDLLARLAAGRASGLSADALSAFVAKLNRLWNPNCDVEGGGGVIVKVHMRLGPDGRLLSPPTVISQDATGAASQAVIEAAARRALSAARQGEPYTEIPRDGPHDFSPTFDAKGACRR